MTDVPVAELTLIDVNGREVLGRLVPRYDRRHRHLVGEWTVPEHCRGCNCGLPYEVTCVGVASANGGPVVEVVPLFPAGARYLLAGDTITVTLPVG